MVWTCVCYIFKLSWSLFAQLYTTPALQHYISRQTLQQETSHFIRENFYGPNWFPHLITEIEIASAKPVHKKVLVPMSDNMGYFQETWWFKSYTIAFKLCMCHHKQYLWFVKKTLKRGMLYKSFTIIIANKPRTTQIHTNTILYRFCACILYIYYAAALTICT